MKEQRDGYGIGLGRVWMQTWICLVLVAVGSIVNPTEVYSCRVYPGRRLPDWLGLCPGRSLSEFCWSGVWARILELLGLCPSRSLSGIAGVVSQSKLVRSRSSSRTAGLCPSRSLSGIAGLCPSRSVSGTAEVVSVEACLHLLGLSQSKLGCICWGCVPAEVCLELLGLCPSCLKLLGLCPSRSLSRITGLVPQLKLVLIYWACAPVEACRELLGLCPS